MSDETLAELRRQVSEADRAILAAVNRRVEVVREIRGHKERNGIAFFDAARERDVVEHRVDENPGPLSDEGVRELFRFVLELVKREAAREG